MESVCTANRRRGTRAGFALTEYFAAAVLASVVALAAVATIVPLRASGQAAAAARQEIETLNQAAQVYRQQHGQFPPSGWSPATAQDAHADLLQRFRYDPQTGTFSRR